MASWLSLKSYGLPPPHLSLVVIFLLHSVSTRSRVGSLSFLPSLFDSLISFLFGLLNFSGDYLLIKLFRLDFVSQLLIELLEIFTGHQLKFQGMTNLKHLYRDGMGGKHNKAENLTKFWLALPIEA